MKKLYYVVFPIVVFCVCAALFEFFFPHRQDRNINAFVQSRLEEITLNHDRYRFELSIHNRCAENNVVNGVQDNSVYPDNIALNTYEYYTVTILRSEKKAKIEHIKTSFNFKNTSANHTDTYTDQIYYITIQGDEVRVYYPENGVYAVRSYNKAGLAEAVSAMLFPMDMRYWYNDKPVQVYTDMKSYPHYDVMREIPADNLYLPFKILRGESYDGRMDASINVHFGMNDETVPSYVFTYRIVMGDITSVYAYAFEACTGKAYENDLGRNGYKNKMSAEIYFYNDSNQVKAFNLPDIP